MIQTQAARVLFQRYELAIKQALLPKLQALNWRGQVFVSVQNLAQPGRLVSPNYMIRIDLQNPNTKNLAERQVVLRNKTISTPLRFDVQSKTEPSGPSCELRLFAQEGEYLVNQDDVPTVLFVPAFQLLQTLNAKTPAPSSRKKRERLHRRSFISTRSNHAL